MFLTNFLWTWNHYPKISCFYSVSCLCAYWIWFLVMGEIILPSKYSQLDFPVTSVFLLVSHLKTQILIFWNKYQKDKKDKMVFQSPWDSDSIILFKSHVEICLVVFFNWSNNDPFVTSFFSHMSPSVLYSVPLPFVFDHSLNYPRVGEVGWVSVHQRHHDTGRIH